jgi:alkanesulfonate monooxygenase SsuD/methylene tetrahydromethanopterin reductase-like flavin-dependent oxidoreductase (luciferase family)
MPVAEPPSTDIPIGIGFTPFEDRLDVIERVAQHAEKRGLAFVSVAEAMSLAAPLVLARLAAVTSHIGLTTGVLSVWGRTPATLAMTAAELQRQSHGRFVLGLGAGTAPPSPSPSPECLAGFKIASMGTWPPKS